MTELTQLDMIEEMKRRKTKRDDLLKAFEKYGTLTTGQIVFIAGTGMSSRIKELKRRGHIISAHHVKGGEWEYTYIGNGGDE